MAKGGLPSQGVRKQLGYLVKVYIYEKNTCELHIRFKREGNKKGAGQISGFFKGVELAWGGSATNVTTRYKYIYFNYGRFGIQKNSDCLTPRPHRGHLREGVKKNHA